MRCLPFLRALLSAASFGLFACGGIAVFDDGLGEGGGSPTDDCSVLLDRFERRLARAAACKPKSATCGVATKNACGCPVFVEDADEAAKASVAYDKAFAKGCFQPCGSCVPSPGASCLPDKSGDNVCTPQR